MNTQTYLEQLKNQINPGTRGAPARRATYEKIKLIHQNHINNLLRVPKSHRPDHHPRHDKNHVRFAGYVERARRDREMAPVVASYMQMSDADLVAALDRYPLGWDSERKYQIIPQVLVEWVNMYHCALSDDRVIGEGQIAKYNEDVRWEKYGRNSYPRVENRYIRKFTRPKSENQYPQSSIVYTLASGERLQSALDKMVPGRAERRESVNRAKMAEPHECYKIVARRDDEKLVSVYDGETEYALGEVVSDKLTRVPSMSDICNGGGIFVHATAERALDQKFPDASAALGFPRVLVRGEYWGRTHVNGKIAAEFFRPIEIVNR